MSEYFEMNECLRRSLAVALFNGSFSKARLMKFLTKYDPYFITNSSVTILVISSLLLM